MRSKIKITPNTPQNESGLTQLITMGESIRQIWVNSICFAMFRDMKPENILLNDEMHIQITDFGSAKILKKESDINTTTGMS